MSGNDNLIVILGFNFLWVRDTDLHRTKLKTDKVPRLNPLKSPVQSPVQSQSSPSAAQCDGKTANSWNEQYWNILGHAQAETHGAIMSDSPYMDVAGSWFMTNNQHLNFSALSRHSLGDLSTIKRST